IIALNRKLQVEYSEVDVDSASRKLNEVARVFEGNSSAVEFQDIASKLSPLEFKVYLEKTFHISLSTHE
ncbi:unnamed protein product, partial [Symbiodinium microadriaticum]